MKRTLILLMACSAVLTSCIHSMGGPDDDSDKIAQAMHKAAVNQMLITTDPLNVAFRFNTLMVESNALGVEVTAPEVAAQKATLLGASTAITADNQGNYTLTYAGGPDKNDYLRTGTIVLKTGGAPLTIGNSWTVSIPKESPYNISNSGLITSIYADLYEVTATAVNTWKIATIACKSETSASTLIGDWSGTFLLVQDDNPGDQSLSSIQKSTYSLSVLDANNVSSMYLTDTLNISTTTPLRFNPACPKGSIVGDGVLVIMFATNPSPYDMTISSWKGTSLTDCDPTIESKYFGKQTLQY